MRSDLTQLTASSSTTTACTPTHIPSLIWQNPTLPQLITMEVASGQSSPPPKTQQEPFDDKTESPILPPQQLKSTDAVRPPSPEKMEEVHLPQPKTQASRTQVKTPEPRNPKERIGNQKDFAERSPSTPGHLAPFDWDDFKRDTSKRSQKPTKKRKHY